MVCSRTDTEVRTMNDTFYIYLCDSFVHTTTEYNIRVVYRLYSELDIFYYNIMSNFIDFEIAIDFND